MIGFLITFVLLAMVSRTYGGVVAEWVALAILIFCAGMFWGAGRPR